MKYSHYRPTIFRYSFLLIAAGLVAAALGSCPVGFAQTASPTAQPDDTTSKATDAVQARVFSGPQPGEKIRPFKALQVTADKTVELEIASNVDSESTTLICFVHKLSNDGRILFGLGLVDFYVSRHKGLTSHFVLVSDDREKITKMLQGWARGAVFKNSVVSLSADGAEGPGYYGLNRHVAMTVVVAKGDSVLSNLVFNAPDNNDLQKIMAAVAKASSEPAPILATVQQEIRDERQRQLDKRIKASPVFKIAPNEQLGRIMFGLVNGRGNQSLVAKRRNKQFLDWAGDDNERRAALRKYCNAVLAGNFMLNRYSRDTIENLAKD